MRESLEVLRKGSAEESESVREIIESAVGAAAAEAAAQLAELGVAVRSEGKEMHDHTVEELQRTKETVEVFLKVSILIQPS